MDVLFQNVCTNEKFLYSAFYSFDNTQVCDLIEQAGCPLKTERGDRVFPVSDHSSDVIAALQRELHKYHVDIHLHTEVKKILTKESDDNICFYGVEEVDRRCLHYLYRWLLLCRYRIHRRRLPVRRRDGA